MLLPTPNPEEIARFRELNKKLYGNELSEINARTELTRLVQFYYSTGGHDAYCQRLEQTQLNVRHEFGI